MRFSRVIAFALCVIAARCDRAADDYAEAISYLQRYGYLSDFVDTVPAFRKQQVLRHAIGLFQEYYGLPGNGTLNVETLRLMHRPRCGLRDILNHATNPPIWPRKALTWNFHLADEETLNTARAAFSLWSEHSSLTFRRDTIKPDIIISWREGRHLNINPPNNASVCLSAFRGVGGVVAHATMPNGRSDFVSEVHVDRSEPWHIAVSRNPENTLYLLPTLTHEIGHSLGLGHSHRSNDVMYGFATEKAYPLALSNVDIHNIQILYGAKNSNAPPRTTTTTTTTTTPPPPPPPPDLCALPRVHVILILDKLIYIAYKRHIWSVDLNGRKYGAPLLISHYLPFLHENYTRITAAYQSPSGHLMLFVDNLVYMVTFPKLTLVPEWPKTTNDLGLPPEAQINGAINTYRGRSFVLYNDYAVGEIDECAKRIVAHMPLGEIFPGIPSGVTSVFRYIDGNLYFVARSQFYKFNEFTRTVTAAGRFDLGMIDIVCPKDGLLQQLRDLLNRIVSIDDALSPTRESDNADE